MKPTQSDVHVNQPLSSILVAFMQDESKGVADKVFPVVPVEHKTDTYYKWDREDFFRIEATERAPGTPSEGGGINPSTDTFDCKEYALHYDVADPIRANADDQLKLDESATRFVGHNLVLKREKVFLDTYFKSGVWTSDQTGVPGAPGANQFKQWDQASSTPIEDIRKQIIAMEEATGYRPNKLVIGPHVEKILTDHAELLDRIKYTQKGVVTMDLLASLLGLDEILVPRLINNTAKEGLAGSYSYLASKSAMLVYAPGAPAINAPSAGYIFAWTKRPGAGPQGQRIKKFRMEEIESDRIEGQMNFAMKLVSADLGRFFITAVA